MSPLPRSSPLLLSEAASAPVHALLPARPESGSAPGAGAPAPLAKHDDAPLTDDRFADAVPPPSDFASPDLDRTPCLAGSLAGHALGSSAGSGTSGAPVSPPLQAGQWGDRASVAGSFMTAEVGERCNGSDYSPVPSIASVRVATKVRAPASASRLGRRSVDQGAGAGEGQWAAEAITNDFATGLGFEPAHLSTSFAQVPALVVPENEEAALGASPSREEVRAARRSSSIMGSPGNNSVADSDQGWKESLDAMVGHLSSSTSDSLRADASPEARFVSILGPKLKMVSKAPWDDGALSDSQASSAMPPTPTPVAAAAPAPAVPRKSGDVRRAPSSGSRTGAGPSPSASPPAKENVKPAKTGRTRSFSFSARRSPAASAGDVAERDDAFRGLGLGLSQAPASVGMAESPSKRSLRARESLTISPPLSVLPSRKSTGSPNKAGAGTPGTPASPPESGSRSAPAHITAFSARETAISGLDSSLGPSLSPVFPEGLPLGPMSLAAKGGAAGPGYKLISLDEARARESERVAAAAVQREAYKKAMQPVEHIAGAETKAREREGTADSTATRSSQAVSTKEGVPRAAVKQRKSGFLKRMMHSQDKQAASHGAEAVPPLPSMDSFRTLASHDDHPPTLPVKNLDTGGIEQWAVSGAPAATGKVAFGATLRPAPDARGVGLSKLPALSLRPMSMAFSAGLPVDFLAGIDGSSGSGSEALGEEDEREQLADAPSPRFAPSITSSTATTSSSVFDSDAASYASASRTPLTPAFPSPSMSPAPLPPTPAPGAHLATPEGYAALREQYARATSSWMKERHALEKEVRDLRDQLERANALVDKERQVARSLAAAAAGGGGGGEEGGGLLAGIGGAVPVVSVLERSRAVRPNQTGGAMFAGARA